MDITDILDAISEDEFDEKPVGVEEFVYSKEFLGLKPLSEYQLQMIRAGSQIYNRDTLESLYGIEEGTKRWKQTFNEIIMQLGKGSGKDYTSTIICAYVVYLLLCLKDPADYYGKPAGDSIDILNVAINAQQASNVFFKNFVERIQRSPWFREKYTAKADGTPARNNEVNFIKNVNVYSGHSERESWEGYNVILVILDEIAGFAMESNTNNENAKTADKIYLMYRGSVDSRFPDQGKVLLLSFPRYKDDFIQRRYAEVVADKEVVIRSHTFKINEDLPDGIPENELYVEWDEDHIISYREPGVFALKRPSWDVNPTRKIDDYKRAFFSTLEDALMRFACMPPYATDALFKDKDQIDRIFARTNPVDDRGVVYPSYVPIEGKDYYIHVDLAQKHDRCAVSLAHADRWVQIEGIGIGDNEPKIVIAPIVIVDLIRYWEPTSDKTVDFKEVKAFILNLRRLGFDIKMVTFDRWNSHDMMMELQQNGLNSEILSVAKKHYDDLKVVMGDSRLSGPNLDILKTELLRLKVKGDKIDHPRPGSKDLADSTCGAVFNVVRLAKREQFATVEIKTWADVKTVTQTAVEAQRPGEIITTPKRVMPEELQSWIDRLGVI